MDYRFEISKPDSNDFRCEIAINGEQTFQQLHDKLVETLNFDGSQMASFFTLDKMGNRGKEIALMEMSADDEEDNNTLVMDVTTIREVVNASCIELEYVYDFFANQYLKVEYAGEYIGDSADVLPLSSFAVLLRRSATNSFSSFGIHTIRSIPPSAFMNFLELMKCLPCPMKPGV